MQTENKVASEENKAYAPKFSSNDCNMLENLITSFFLVSLNIVSVLHKILILKDGEIK